MGQVTIYLQDEIEEKMALAAKSANLSKSKWVANLINTNVANEWPESVVNLAGAWDDFPSVKEIRSNLGHDSTREDL